MAESCACILHRPSKAQRDRAFDDLTRTYFVAYSRAQDVLLLVGNTKVTDGTLPHVALGWDRDGHHHWAGLPNLTRI